MALTGVILIMATAFPTFLSAYPPAYPPQSEKNKGTPKLVFKSLVYDAGTVKPGDTVSGEFIMENKGNADLIIESARPT